MDLCTRKVLARRISNTLEAPFCVEAFNEAIHKFGSPEIMNMEHGRAIGSSGHATSRVAVHIFRLDRRAETGREPDINATRCLQRKHLPVPDGKGRWVDNIFIERLWWSLEYECVYLHAWETGSQARNGIGRWITFYNYHRPHHSSEKQSTGLFSGPPQTWRLTARRGLRQQHWNRSAGADSSLNKPEICPKIGGSSRSGIKPQ